MSLTDNRVVITGVGIVCSLGIGREEVWNAMLSGKTGISSIRGFDASGFECTSAAQAKDLNPRDLGIHPRDSRIMDTHSYMLMKCAHDAFSQAGLDKASLPKEDIGFFAGMGMVDYKAEDLLPSVLKSLNSSGSLNYDMFYTDGYREIYPLWPLSMLNNISFCQVAISLDMRGENTVFSPHADSGAQAIAEGMQTLLEGRAQAVLCGGVSEKISPFSLARGLLSGILNTSNNLTEPACRPFAAGRNGTVPGEGCGVLTLESYKSAVERGMQCLTSVTGYSFAFESDGKFSGPAARALGNAMQGALNSAGLKPSDIDLIIAHGDGTISGDKNEIHAIHEIFADCIDKVNVFSSKGALGHLLAGAPAVDVILGISMLESGIVPQTITSSPDSSILFNLVRKPLRMNLQKILINCQSCEGQAASIIIEAVR
jgi:3-oxoacyl-[acyl-carrier-protein] synthase II